MSAGSGLLVAVILVALAIRPVHAQPGPTQAELNAAAANATDWLHTNHDAVPAPAPREEAVPSGVKP